MTPVFSCAGWMKVRSTSKMIFEVWNTWIWQCEEVVEGKDVVAFISYNQQKKSQGMTGKLVLQGDVANWDAQVSRKSFTDPFIIGQEFQGTFLRWPHADYPHHLMLSIDGAPPLKSQQNGLDHLGVMQNLLGKNWLQLDLICLGKSTWLCGSRGNIASHPPLQASG